MADLNELIERREIEIRCWHCSWAESRTLSWISALRHMTCPTCSSVIVLDGSELRREISLQRKQLEVLHGQMVSLLQSASKIARRAQLPPPRMTGLAPKMDLALARSHPNTLMHALRPASAAKRLHR